MSGGQPLDGSAQVAELDCGNGVAVLFSPPCRERRSWGSEVELRLAIKPLAYVRDVKKRG